MNEAEKSIGLIGPDHYRFVDNLDPQGLEVCCVTYKVIGETAQCWYIADQYVVDLMRGHQWPWVAAEVKKRRKRVLKDTGPCSKRFAYPNKDHALRSYKVRKQWQIMHAERSLERAKAALGYFGDSTVNSTTPEAKKLIIPNEYIQGLAWGDC
jgi:hypothetical protein